MLVGYVLVVPLTALLFGDRETVEQWWDGDEVTNSERNDPDRDPVQTLRDRYARGELTDQGFERRLERLIETESLESDSQPPARPMDSIDRELDRE